MGVFRRTGRAPIARPGRRRWVPTRLPVSYTGATASTWTFTATDAGKVTAKAATASTYTFTATDAGRVTAKAATASTYTLTATDAGKLTAKTATASAYTLTITTAGKATAKSTTSSAWTITVTTLGLVGDESASSSVWTWTATTNGTVTTPAFGPGDGECALLLGDGGFIFLGDGSGVLLLGSCVGTTPTVGGGGLPQVHRVKRVFDDEEALILVLAIAASDRRNRVLTHA